MASCRAPTPVHTRASGAALLLLTRASKEQRRPPRQAHANKPGPASLVDRIQLSKRRAAVSAAAVGRVGARTARAASAGNRPCQAGPASPGTIQQMICGAQAKTDCHPCRAPRHGSRSPGVRLGSPSLGAKEETHGKRPHAAGQAEGDSEISRRRHERFFAPPSRPWQAGSGLK